MLDDDSIVVSISDIRWKVSVHNSKMNDNEHKPCAGIVGATLNWPATPPKSTRPHHIKHHLIALTNTALKYRAAQSSAEQYIRTRNSNNSVIAIIRRRAGSMKRSTCSSSLSSAITPEICRPRGGGVGIKKRVYQASLIKMRVTIPCRQHRQNNNNASNIPVAFSDLILSSILVSMRSHSLAWFFISMRVRWSMNWESAFAPLPTGVLPEAHRKMLDVNG